MLKATNGAISINTSHYIRVGGKLLGGFSNVAGVVSLAVDANDPLVSPERLSYRTLGFLSSLGVTGYMTAAGGSGGGPAGAIAGAGVGLLFQGGEIVYDGFMKAKEVVIQETSRFQYSLKNWVPRK